MSAWLKYANPADHASPTGPDYYRDQFPYTLPPLVQFERQPVPLNPDHPIWITDTTFRDGQQSRAPYSVDQIVCTHASTAVAAASTAPLPMRVATSTPR